MSLKVKAMLATAVFSIGLFVNASPIWAEPQPLTIPSNGRRKKSTQRII